MLEILFFQLGYCCDKLEGYAYESGHDRQSACLYVRIEELRETLQHFLLKKWEMESLEIYKIEVLGVVVNIMKVQGTWYLESGTNKISLKKDFEHSKEIATQEVIDLVLKKLDREIRGYD